MDEREAIAALKAGEIGALEVLVRAHYVRALRAAYLVTRDHALAEDVVQGAFLRAYERIGQFDARRPFAPWFLRSVMNAAVTAAERQRVYTAPDAARANAPDGQWVGLIDPGPPPEELVLHAETREEIRVALARLPAAQCAAIVGRYYLGLSEGELAADLDCPPGTVKWRLHTARRQLRTLLRPLANHL